MIGTEPTNCERLYLYKDNENDIYVDNCQNLKQHQVNSLRFLYRQFKKKINGAVLNFPPGSGKSLVVSLFLNAISSLLNERILIFCTDDEEMDHWKQLLLTWTDYKSDEIAEESSNPRLKKKIFLKKAEDLNSYLRCRWSVVVVKDENMSKILKKVVLDADLKIWITSTDIKKDVELLLFIYTWMFPKSNVNINEIITSHVTRDTMIQSIKLDAFLNDFVITENKVKVIKETKNSEELKLYRNNNQKGITRKNKDATGNKIKKSKRTIDDITPTEQINLPDVSNISTEEVKAEPQPEISANDLEEDKTYAYNFDLKLNTVQDEGNSSDLMQMNQNNTIKVETNAEESLNLRTENDIVTETVEENSTESLDFEENIDSTESLDFGDGSADNVNNKNLLDIQESCNHDVKNVDVKMELDMNNVATEKSEMSLNILDSKMSEVEEKTMKKFKGSLLDSLF